MKKVSVQVPATTANLGPGFDILGAALQLFNEVHAECDEHGWSSKPLKTAVSFAVEGEGAPGLPHDSSNLAVRAAFRVFETARQWPRHISMRLVNRIPLTSGLGSSAAATLGAMAAVNRLLPKPLADSMILDMAVAMEGHPDNVVPAMTGGLCASVWNEGRTRYLRFWIPSNLRAVVCIPARQLATAKARRILPQRVPLSAAVFTASRTAFLIGSLLQRRYDWLSFAMQDVLHQPARASLVPGLRDVLEAAVRAGAWGAALSGAGPSVFAITRPGPTARRVGEAMQRRFAAKGIKSAWLKLKFENKGIRIQ